MDKTLNKLNNIRKEEIKEKRNIFFMYIVLFSSYVGTVTVNGPVSVFCIMICVCTLATVYAARSKSEEDSLLENQCTYLIRTFWKTTFLLICSLAAAFLLLLFTMDYTPLKPCVSVIEQRLISAISDWNSTLINKILRSCSSIFIKHNSETLNFGSIIAFSPPLVYLIFRFGRGIKYLKKLKIIPTKKL